LYNLIRLLTRQ